MGERDPWTNEAFEREVRDTAYFLWENDGRPSGQEEEYWFRALEQRLRQRHCDSLLSKAPAEGGPDADVPSGGPK